MSFIIDYTYDAYGTFDELVPFIDEIQRFSTVISEICLSSPSKRYNEMEEMLTKECSRHKLTKKEAKLVVTAVKNTSFGRLYEEDRGRGMDRRLFTLSKVKERRSRDLDQVKCVKDEDGKVSLYEAHIRRRWQIYFHSLLNEEGD
ncbi:uncharacterized protein [Nicotiana sylvestris]|uniref:uncharacterized protein n=1 Tax=Nicotiana sylvestris TaxID=4096 RepID=UPI00388C4C61